MKGRKRVLGNRVQPEAAELPHEVLGAVALDDDRAGLEHEGRSRAAVLLVAERVRANLNGFAAVLAGVEQARLRDDTGDASSRVGFFLLNMDFVS